MKRHYKLLCAVLLLLLFLTACVSQEAKNVIDEIDGIGEITLESEETLTKIFADYNSLDDKDKEQVENYEKLQSAIDEYNVLAKDRFISSLDSYDYDTVDKLSSKIDDFWDMFNDEEKEQVLFTLGRCQMKDAFADKIKEHLKSPDSFNLYSCEYTGPTSMEPGYFSTITIKYGATNSFGGEVTSTLMASVRFHVDIDNKNVEFDSVMCPQLDYISYPY